MFNVKHGFILSFLFLLNGCAVGNNVNYDMNAYNKANLSFIGIPTILGIGRSGTSFAISPHYSITTITTAESTFSTIEAKHPFCDIALIKHDNDEVDYPVFSSVGVGNPVQNFGYSAFTAMPVSSEGKVQMYTKIKLKNSETRCTLMYSDMGYLYGMSGGPVYNFLNHNLVGVSIDYQIGYFNTKKDIFHGKPGTLFIPFQNFRNWLIDMLDKTEDKGLLKIDYEYDFYNDDTGDIALDKLKNKYHERLLLQKNIK